MLLQEVLRTRINPSHKILLRHIMDNAGSVVTVDDLMGQLYGMRPDGGPLWARSMITKYICEIRKALKEDRLKSVGKRGYTFE